MTSFFSYFFVCVCLTRNEKEGWWVKLVLCIDFEIEIDNEMASSPKPRMNDGYLLLIYGGDQERGEATRKEK